MIKAWNCYPLRFSILEFADFFPFVDPIQNVVIDIANRDAILFARCIKHISKVTSVYCRNVSDVACQRKRRGKNVAVISFTAMRRNAEGKNTRCVSRILVKETKISVRDKRGEGGERDTNEARRAPYILHPPSFSSIPSRSNNGSSDRAYVSAGSRTNARKLIGDVSNFYEHFMKDDAIVCRRDKYVRID